MPQSRKRFRLPCLQLLLRGIILYVRKHRRVGYVLPCLLQPIALLGFTEKDEFPCSLILQVWFRRDVPECGTALNQGPRESIPFIREAALREQHHRFCQSEPL